MNNQTKSMSWADAASKMKSKNSDDIVSTSQKPITALRMKIDAPVSNANRAVRSKPKLVNTPEEVFDNWHY